MDGICTVVHAKQKKRNQNLVLKESSNVYNIQFTRHVYTENALKIYLRLAGCPYKYRNTLWIGHKFEIN